MKQSKESASRMGAERFFFSLHMKGWMNQSAYPSVSDPTRLSVRLGHPMIEAAIGCGRKQSMVRCRLRLSKDALSVGTRWECSYHYAMRTPSSFNAISQPMPSVLFPKGRLLLLLIGACAFITQWMPARRSSYDTMMPISGCGRGSSDAMLHVPREIMDFIQ
jgi:hypothetical protein